MGYSMPSTSPSTVVACGQGYIPHVSLKCLIVNHAILLASSHGVAPGRYRVWIRMPFHPDASQRKSGDAAHATSRTCWARRCQVLVPGTRFAPFASASAFGLIGTDATDARAAPRRARTGAGQTRARCTTGAAAA